MVYAAVRVNARVTPVTPRVPCSLTDDSYTQTVVKIPECASTKRRVVARSTVLFSLKWSVVVAPSLGLLCHLPNRENSLTIESTRGSTRGADRTPSTYCPPTSGFRCLAVLTFCRCLTATVRIQGCGTGVTTSVPCLFTTGVLSVSTRVFVCQPQAGRTTQRSNCGSFRGCAAVLVT